MIWRSDPGEPKIAASLVGRPLRFAETGDSTVLTAEPVGDAVLLSPSPSRTGAVPRCS